MRATFVIALVLSASVLSAEAARTRIAAQTSSGGVLTNAKEIQERVQLVDWSTPKDAWIVFETDGIGVKEYVNTLDNSNPVTLPAFLDTLQACGPRGVACFGLFKFNHRRSEKSTTLLGKTVLIVANDSPALKQKLGLMAGMKVSMGCSSTVWEKFKKAIKVSFPYKETAHPGKLTAEDIWERFTSTNAEEKKMFLEHVESLEDGSHGSPSSPITPVTPDDAGDQEGHGSDSSAHGGDSSGHGGDSSGHGGDSSGGSGGTMDARQTERLIQSAVKQAKAEMKDEIEEISTKEARSEVGQALRKLGTDVGDKIRAVGEVWMTKSRGR